MSYYYNGNDLIYTESGYLVASKNDNTKKYPNCHRETPIDLDKCENCDYDFINGIIDKLYVSKL